MKKEIKAASASAGDGPYSQGIAANGFAFVSGQGPLDPQTGAIIGSTITEQAEVTLRNVITILEAAGCRADDVVQITVFLADLADFSEFNHVYMRFFQRPYPARSCVAAGLDGILVEIDAVAAVPQ